MKNDLLIGIVSRKYKINKKTVFGIYENYLKKITINGGIPIIIVDYNTSILKKCSGFIIPGGDVSSNLDYMVRDYAIKNNIPLLGICLGMQILVDEKLTLTKNHNNLNHKILIKENSILKSIYKENYIIVNSRHSYKIKTSLNYKISAIASDGVIEAIEKENVLGVQYHPEDLSDNKIFDYFIFKCNKIRQKNS